MLVFSETERGGNPPDGQFIPAARFAVIRDVTQGIIPERTLRRIFEIYVDNAVSVLTQIRRIAVKKIALRVGNHHRFRFLQNIRHDIAARLTGTGRSDDQVVIVTAGQPGIVGNPAELTVDNTK